MIHPPSPDEYDDTDRVYNHLSEVEVLIDHGTAYALAFPGWVMFAVHSGGKFSDGRACMTIGQARRAAWEIQRACDRAEGKIVCACVPDACEHGPCIFEPSHTDEDCTCAFVLTDKGRASHGTTEVVR